MGFLQLGVLCKAVPGLHVLPPEQGEAVLLPVPPSKLGEAEPWQPGGVLGTWVCLQGKGLGNRAGCHQKSARLLAKVCLNDTAP